MRVVHWFPIAVVSAVLAIGMTACGEYEEPGVDRERTENSMMERMEEQREGQQDGERGGGGY